MEKNEEDAAILARSLKFRGSLTQDERNRFSMNDEDTLSDTVMALVSEVIFLQEKVKRLDKNPRR